MLFITNCIVPMLIYAITFLLLSEAITICLYCVEPDIIRYIPWMYVIIIIMVAIASVLFSLLGEQIYLSYLS